MLRRKTAYLLVLFVFLGIAGSVFGAEENTRYLVRSKSGFWKKSFGIRHDFKEGFTTDLADWQLRVAKVFGVEVVSVKKFYILNSELLALESTPTPSAEPVLASPTPDIVPVKPEPKVEIDARKPGSTPIPSITPLPFDQLPWGVRAVYDDLLLSKTSGGKDINIAVLDTGIFKDHSDLVRRVVQCKDFTQAKKPISDNQCDDKNGHGTHVSGTIVADGGSNGVGIYGLVPEANLFVYKVCGNNGSCWSDDIAMGIMTAADNGTNVLNLSLGGDNESSLIKDAISYAVSKNVLVVAAAGNDGPYIGSIDYPGANSDVVAVGAFDSSYNVAEWSSRGSNSATNPDTIEEGDIEFASPGVNIESTWKDGGYVILSGTSMATPHITGLAAKLWQKDVDDPDSATRTLLHTFSQDLSPIGDDDASGFGFPHL